MKKIISIFALMVMLLSTFSFGGYTVGADWGWNGENSILVTVTVAEDQTFSPEDFPEISATEVIVAGKTIENDEYCYDLIL